MPLNPLSPECCHCHTSSVHFLSFFFCFFFNLYSITLSRSLSTQGDGRHSRKGIFLLSSDHLQSPPIIPFFSFLNLCSFNLSSFMRLSNLFFFFYNGLFLPFWDYYLPFLLHPSHQSPVDYPNFII